MKVIVGVMGGSVTDDAVFQAATELGRMIAEEGWVLLNGGRDSGVMRASAQGAHEAGGLVVGILPDESSSLIAPGVDIPIHTGMGDARNVINVLSSRVVIALPGGAGTVSEIAHALKLGRAVIAVGFDTCDLFKSYEEGGHLSHVESPAEAIAITRQLLAGGRT